MPENLKLVQHFVKSFIDGNVVKLPNLVSPDFEYWLNYNECYDFDQFIKRLGFMVSSTNFTPHEISTEDNIHFYFDFELELPAPNDGVISAGFAQAIVRNGLISRIDINHKGEKSKFEEFKELRSNSPTALL